MMITRRAAFFLSSLFVAGSLGACGTEQPAATAAPRPAAATPPVVGTHGQARGRVETVDQTARDVLVRLSNNRYLSIDAGPQVQNLAQIQPGNNVTVDYH